MAKRHRKQLGSERDVHARQLVVARNAIRTSVQIINAKLNAGDCARADAELRRGTYFEGQAAVHFDATEPMLAQGAFRDSSEARALAETAQRFRAVCVRDRIKKG